MNYGYTYIPELYYSGYGNLYIQYVIFPPKKQRLSTSSEKSEDKITPH